MKKLPFKHSEEVSLGVELEFQIIDPITFDLISKAKDLLRNISESGYHDQIKPEITQSMIEINSSIHRNPKSLHQELNEMKEFLLAEARQVGVCFSGGGTHPFQKWSLCKIFPAKRYKRLSAQYKYLSKIATVFGLHVHVGCKSAEDALYLTHALIRYVPHFIALTASSPFYQDMDTGYNSSRLNVLNAFPMSGVIPFLTTWKEFSAYFFKMRKAGILQSMKDVYWDIRPKPEFGTVEIRVCDTPLNIEKAVLAAAYIQIISDYLLRERPFEITHDLYYLYTFNRFQASRYGYEGNIIKPDTLEHIQIADDMSEALKNIEKYTAELHAENYIAQVRAEIKSKQNDATRLRELYSEVKSLPRLVSEQCRIWAKE